MDSFIDVILTACVYLCTVQAVITKIKEVSKSHIIYPGLQDFKNGIKEVDPMTVPGISTTRSPSSVCNAAATFV